MSNARNHPLPTGVDIGSDGSVRDWRWGAIPGRWAVGPALTVLAAISLAVWTGVLLLLLH